MSTLERLGFAPDDKVVVVHVDDVGMSGPANRGALRAFGGAATCGSVMVPCPGFAEAIALAAGRPELDLGVHLTLNAEYETLRWDPVAADVPGLLAPYGGMWKTTDEVVANASPDEVERELRAQIERALGAGLDVTHLDAHMGTVFNPKFVDCYFALAREYRLPAFIPRISRETLERAGMPPSLERYVGLIEQAEALGFPIFDQFDSDSLSFVPGTGPEHNRQRVEQLGSGLSYLITHCAEGGDELESITHDWQQRDEEQRIYSDGTMGSWFEERGVRTLGMRPLRDLLRESL
jgi:predicted glycoside hydrolase/deacetylase ChbG (UPF0249 family)